LPATRIADLTGYRFARLDVEPGGRRGRFLSPEGEELGTVSHAERGNLVTFHPRSNQNPFIRMMLLAAILQL
jgi:hypothetical protein